MASPSSDSPALAMPSDVAPSAFLLELCGVLYDDSCWRRWMLQLLTRMGLRTQYTVFYQTWEQEHYARVCSGEVHYWDAMRAFLRSAGMPEGRVDEACAAGQSRRLQWDKSIHPLPGVRESLEQLARMEIPIAIIAHASFDHSTAVEKLQQLDLLKYVSHGTLATSEIGGLGHYACRFQAAAQVLGRPASEVAYVGCSRLPLEQAAEDGLQCFSYNTQLNAAPAKHLSSFRRLPQLVAPRPLIHKQAS